MKFESFEVEQMYYEILKKYKINHINFGSTYDYTKMTYDDLLEIEENCKDFMDMVNEKYKDIDK